MAPRSQLNSKKRRASVPEDEVAKAQKVQKMASDALPKKRKATDDAALDSKKKAKALATENNIESATKKAKVSSTVAEEVLASKPKSSKDVSKAEKKLKKAAIIEEPESEIVEDISADEDDSDAYEVIDDQTEALLKGFESEDDDEPSETHDRTGEQIPELDKKAKKKLKKLQEKLAEKAKSEGPGVVYLGRIPHGFYENEMRQYFSQFGDIKNIRLSRNPKTGASKHYAFIQFDSYDVAEIVAKTMDNYLMFGHIMKCKVVPKDQVHDNLFIGANRRFKKVPWNKLEGRKLAMGSGETKWEERIEREKQRREKRNTALLKTIGYSYDGPALKSAKAVPKHARTSLALEGEAEEELNQVKAIEPSNEVVTTVTTTTAVENGKKKKTKKARVVVDGIVAEETKVEEEPQGLSAEDAFAASAETKAKKAKKAKRVSEVVAEDPTLAVVEEVAEVAPVEAASKKKGKKSKAKAAA